jgi:hypothetical protein
MNPEPFNPNDHFDSLLIPDDRWRLDRLLGPSRRTASGRRRLWFESQEACWAEDIRRAQALRELPKALYEGVEDCDPEALAEILIDAARTRRVPKCSASAAYMRDRRLALLSSIYRLVDENPDTDVKFVTVGSPAWLFNLRYQWDLLRWVGLQFGYFHDYSLRSASGFLIGCMRGIYDADAGNLQLEFRGLCGGEKLKEFGQPEERDERHMFYADKHEVWDLPRQLSAMMPNRIAERPEGQVGDHTRGTKRMREPYHSIYLMWLARREMTNVVFAQGHRLRAMVYVDGIDIDETGRFIIERRSIVKDE